MKKMTSNEIRNMFLKFFESKGHMIVPSASLIPDNDPSILWINAGVAPLKKYFDGREVPPKKRLTNSQKCIRTNDIENVGDTYHHTFFEMLGNFSIGDYFRNEALEYAWELLTSDKYFNFDKDKLYVTVYPDDTESYEKWIKLGLDESHIIKNKDNFWDIGPGPCGPDSEIFYDRGEKYDKRGPELIEKDIDNDRFIEIWNNVFSQFNHIDGKERKDFPELPHKNIDTGMGLERLVSIIQDVDTNYDTDLFMPIINKIEELSGVKYSDQREIRAIADHIKTLTFALADGASFSNEGRGYILRRVLRRASRFGRKLGIYEPFMYKLVPTVAEMMNDYYPYLMDNKENIQNKIKSEEAMFLKTLSAGEKRLKDSGNKITGSDVFKLYDTYGFPYELTVEILKEENIFVDKEEFDKCMENQKNMARSAAKETSGMNVLGDLVNFKDESKFVGYDSLTCDAKVIFVGDNSGNISDIYSEGIIITDKTPFYATMGGQKGDTGYIYSNDFKAEVLRTEKAPNGQNMHYVRIISGSIKKGDTVTLKVDENKRYTTCQNHSATHLLQKALQDILGESVHQAGSYVDDETLRFDFNYEGKISDEDIIKVEEKVNEMIDNGYERNLTITTLEEAKKMHAMALFSDKYKDSVRVVSFGPSVELCGGTHVNNTKDIKRFAIKSIESKGANVYRIEAVCDLNLENEVFSMIKPYNDEMILLLKKAKAIVDNANLDGINLKFNFDISNERPKCYKDILENKEEVTNLRKNLAKLEKEYKDALASKLINDADKYLSNKVKGKYGDVLILEFNDTDINLLKQLTGALINRLDNGIIFIYNLNGTSVNFIAKANESLKDTISMGELIKNVSTIANGRGGGSASFAQGGSSETDKLNMIINYVKDKLL